MNKMAEVNELRRVLKEFIEFLEAEEDVGVLPGLRAMSEMVESDDLDAEKVKDLKAMLRDLARGGVGSGSLYDIALQWRDDFEERRRLHAKLRKLRDRMVELVGSL